MNIGDKVKNLRLSKMMTQKQLAGDMITRNMLSRIENGAALPSVPTIVYLAERLNVPAGFLLADENDSFLYRKMSLISDIKKAYTEGEYSIARELCAKLNDGNDDEINYIISECDLKIASDEVMAGNLHSARRYLDESLIYASKTFYRTTAPENMCRIYFRYLGYISPSLNSDVIDDIKTNFTSCDDMFCNYIIALENIQNGIPDDEKISSDCSGILKKHLQAKKMLQTGDYSKAFDILNELFDESDMIPPTVLYEVYSDLELCAKSLDDYRAAYNYSNNKIRQLEKLLSGS